MSSSEGHHVWLRDPHLVWVQGEIVGIEDGRLRVSVAGELVVVAASEAIPKNPACEEGGDDLAALSHLDEPNVLHNLELRFSATQIYTWTGSILMALNPWRHIDGLYSSERLEEYCFFEDVRPAPHVFAVANKAYRSMLADGRRQCILVSGDSGSGKTETTKYLMHQLAAVSSMMAGGRSKSEMYVSTEKQLLDSNPLLEAFGNAKTLRNDNSSRFGKFLTLQFEDCLQTSSPKISGATIQTYLLEKSRVVRVASGERNYHIFHQLCQEASSPKGSVATTQGLDLERRHFRILGECIQQADDQERFREMRNALVSIGVTAEECSNIMQSLAGLLHLGNIEFKADTEKKGCSDVDTAILMSEESAQIASRLLACEEDFLKESVLCRKVKTVGETVTVNYSREQAETARDSLLKAIYGKIFTWLIERVNMSLARDSRIGPNNNAAHPQGAGSHMQIGILDIFGFETFEVNGFEQFCINYANEKLQLQFNHFVFQLEQDEYEREKIPWTHIDFNDNQPCINVIEGRPGGILDILDEECRVPRGSDSGFASKARAVKSLHVKFPKTTSEVFTIVHYAGAVSYNTTGFLERNKVRSFDSWLVEQDLCVCDFLPLLIALLNILFTQNH